jgi:hypothetical protein
MGLNVRPSDRRLDCRSRTIVIAGYVDTLGVSLPG